jgi:hypothetical protein
MSDEKKKYVMRLDLSVVAENPPVFKKGWKPGVLVTADHEYHLTEEEVKSTMFTRELLNQSDELIKEYIKVDITQVK